MGMKYWLLLILLYNLNVKSPAQDWKPCREMSEKLAELQDPKVNAIMKVYIPQIQKLNDKVLIELK